jgi:two-component system, OmpR family, clock-associated histidine kinase SasA
MFPSDLSSELNDGLEAPLQLVLFVDRRAGIEAQVKQIREHLQELPSEFCFDLKIVDVGEHPYLAEHFRLVATPSLIKMNPAPRQTLAGRKLLEQLDSWWPRWQQQVREIQDWQTDAVPQGADPSPPSLLALSGFSGRTAALG